MDFKFGFVVVVRHRAYCNGCGWLVSLWEFEMMRLGSGLSDVMEEFVFVNSTAALVNIFPTFIA